MPHTMYAARRTTLLIFVLSVFCFAVHAQEIRDLTPDESVRLGLERNHRLRSTRADAAEAHAAMRQAQAARFPTVQTLADYTRLSGNIPEVDFMLPGIDTTFTILPVELNRYHSEVTVSQPLFSGFRIRNQIRAAGHEAEAALLTVEQEAADVAFEIRRAYWTLYQAMAVRDVVHVARAHMDAHVADVQARVDEGTALRGELLSARTRRSEVQLEGVEAENAVRIGQLELSRLIGLPLDTSVRPSDDIAPVTGEIDVFDVPAQAAEAQPQIRALAERVRGLRLQVDAARGTWFPEVSVVGRYIYARPNPYFFAEQDQFRGTGEVRLALQWTLFEGGRRSAQTAQARARLHSAEALLDDAREQAAVDIVRRQLEAQRAEEAVRVAELHVDEASEAFRIVNEQFAEGLVLSAQVLEAEQAFRAAQTRRARAVAEYAVARAALLHARGETW